jgi:hypothetical protein
MQTLEITANPDSERVTLLMDNHLHITARKNSRGEVIFSEQMESLTDDKEYKAVQEIARIVLDLESMQ